MDRTYNVGADNSSIGFEVRVGSAATCFTGAYQFLAGGQKVLKGESLKADNGAIQPKPLGNGSDLKNTKLSVQTIADLSALPADVIAAIKSDPHTLKVNLKIEYLFNGGTAGQQTFDYDYDDYMISSNGKTAVVTKHILLVP